MRIVLMVQGFSGYLDACFRALADAGATLFIVAPRSMSDTNFDASGFGDYATVQWWSEPPDVGALVSSVDAFAPDVVLMGSWQGPPAYRRVMTTRPADVLRILVMDNQWWATPKQWLGRATQRIYLRPLYDCVFVPSDRTEFFARRLGFAADQIIRGFYVADVETFRTPPRDGGEVASHRRFLFAGRLTEEKGADVLAQAYRRYRSAVDDPWDLSVVGTGPLAGEFAGVAGVTMHGFVQPPQLAQLMREASCFVLPTLFESYGVVVHEATTAGLPILCADTAGASPGLVQDGSNGWAVPSGDVAAWARYLARMSRQDPARLGEMSAVSQALASRLHPRAWARHLLEEIAERRATT